MEICTKLMLLLQSLPAVVAAAARPLRCASLVYQRFCVWLLMGGLNWGFPVTNFPVFTQDMLEVWKGSFALVEDVPRLMAILALPH